MSKDISTPEQRLGAAIFVTSFLLTVATAFAAVWTSGSLSSRFWLSAFLLLVITIISLFTAAQF